MEFSEEEIRRIVSFAPSAGPETPNELDEIERLLSIRYPANFRKILLIGAEGHVGPVASVADSELHFDFLPLLRERFEYVSTRVRDAHERLLRANRDLARVIPFGAVGNGDMVCFDFRAGSDPVVALWHHDKARSQPEPFSLLARNFDELLDRASPANFARYKSGDAGLSAGEIERLLRQHSLNR